MLSYESLAELVSRISYKPGWSFKLGRDGAVFQCDTYTLFIQAQVPDSRDPEQIVEFVMKRMVPEYLHDEDMFLKWVKHTLTEAEVHEMREFFRFDGELVDDPHKAVKVL